MSNRYDAIMQNLGAVVKSPSATEEQLQDVERRLGVPLPADYREFVRDYGDSVFYSDTGFPCIQDGSNRTETVFMFWGATNNDDNIADGYLDALERGDVDTEFYPGLSLIRPMEGITWMSWPEELLSIGIDQGGNQTCLAISGFLPGAVFFWVNAPRSGDNLYLIANTFDEFAHLLRKL